MRYALFHLYMNSHDEQKSVIDLYADDTTRHILRTIRPGQTFTLPQVEFAPCLSHLQRRTRMIYLGVILRNHIAAFPFDGGHIVLKDESTKPYTWMVPNHSRVDPARWTIGASTFADRVGDWPEDWELEHVNCPFAGTIGHYACGWCDFHNQPILICGCRNRNDEERS